MDKNLSFEILTIFNELSGIPVHIVDGANLIFTTLDENMLADTRAEFFNLFDKDRIDIRIFNDIEYYVSLPIKLEERTVNIILGASFRNNPISVGFRGKLVLSKLINREKLKYFLLTVRTVRDVQFVKYADIISRLFGGEPATMDMINYSENPFRKSLDGKLAEYIFETRENELNPYAPELEQKILEMVKAGDVEGLKKLNINLDANAVGLEVKYLFKIVALVTLAARAAMECGVDSVKAYGLSDLYLTRLGESKNDSQISDIARSVLPQFAELVNKKDELAEDKYSPHLEKAMKYIKTHLHFPLSLSIVADKIGVSQKYLSRLFVVNKKEKFTQYVNRQRVFEAKELLVNTDMKLVDIAYSLSFVSESYFIKVFNEATGMTPQKYRNKYKTIHN